MKQILVFAFLFFHIHTVSAQSKRIDSLKSVLAKTTEPMERYKLLTEIFYGYYTTGDGENTVEDNLEMVRIALQQKNDSLTAVSYNRAGAFYAFQKSDFNTGLDYLFKGIPYAEKSGNKRTLSSLYVDISQCYRYLGNPDECLDFLKKSEASLPDTIHADYKYLLLQIHAVYGVYYLGQHEPKLALPYINSAIELGETLNYPIWTSLGVAALGGYYAQTGDTGIAQLQYKKAVGMFKENFFPFANAIVKSMYANFLLDTKNYTEAITQARDIYDIGEKSSNNYLKFIAAGSLKNIYDANHNIDSAYIFSKAEYAWRDSIFSQEKLNKIQALNFNEEVRARQAEEERHQNIQYVVITLGIIIFITIFLLLSRTIIVNERLISFFAILGLLVVFEFINLLIHPWLASFTHESPVLMLLALVIIASLLIPLHHRLEHWIKEKMIEKNKAIRLAAAKKTIEQLEKKPENI